MLKMENKNMLTRIALAAIAFFPIGGNYAEAQLQRVSSQSSQENNDIKEFPKTINGAILEALRGGNLFVVNISKQLAAIYVNGKLVNTFPVSTGKKGKETPLGLWKPERFLGEDHRSNVYLRRKGEGYEMPFAVGLHPLFISKTGGVFRRVFKKIPPEKNRYAGIAIHYNDDVSGGFGSSGCIRVDDYDLSRKIHNRVLTKKGSLVLITDSFKDVDGDFFQLRDLQEKPSVVVNGFKRK
jgi:hypothetical protein